MDIQEKSNTHLIDSQDSEEKILDEITIIQQQLEREKELKLRAIADYHNQKKIYDKQFEEIGYLANKNIINQILEVIDDIQRAKEYGGKPTIEATNEIEQLHSKLVNIISTQNIIEMPVNVGDEFDPELMEAIATSPVEKEEMINKILTVVQKGYKLSNDKILRTTKVIVGKK